MKQSEIFRENAENCAHLAEARPTNLPSIATSGWRPRGVRSPTNRTGSTAKFLPRAFRSSTPATAMRRPSKHRPRADESRKLMKIVEHSESHIVKLHDGSAWQIFPGDIDQTLTWLPTSELRLFEINDEIASHALINADDGTRVRVRPLGEPWPEERTKKILKQG